MESPRKIVGWFCGAILLIFVLREVVRFVMAWWLAFCVFYTTSDLWKKRKIVVKYWKMGKKLGLIPEWVYTTTNIVKRNKRK